MESNSANVVNNGLIGAFRYICSAFGCHAGWWRGWWKGERRISNTRQPPRCLWPICIGPGSSYGNHLFTIAGEFQVQAVPIGGAMIGSGLFVHPKGACRGPTIRRPVTRPNVRRAAILPIKAATGESIGHENSGKGIQDAFARISPRSVPIRVT